MCDPVSIGLAMTAAGSVAQAAGQSKARKAMNGAREAERIRQLGLQGKSDELVSESTAHADRRVSDADQAAAENKRKADYAAAAAATPAAAAPQTQITAGDANANKVINTETAARNAAAIGGATQQGNAKAALQGFNDNSISQLLYNNRMMQRQGLIGNFMQGSAGVLPYEMDAASRKGDSLKGLGSALSTAGTLVGMGGGAGWFGNGAPGITESIDMAKIDPAAFQSTYSIANPANPTFLGTQQIATPSQLSGWGLKGIDGNFLKYYKPIR